MNWTDIVRQFAEVDVLCGNYGITERGGELF
jgi:hypothetical protein